MSTGRFFSKGVVRKCSSICVEAGEHGAEVVRADGEHGGEADGRVHGVAAADPVPEAEHVGGVDAELGDFFGVGGDGDEVFGDGGLSSPSLSSAHSRAVCALVMVSSVVKVFEETMKRVSSASRSRDGFGEVGAVDVGDEAEGHIALAVVLSAS